jgi:transcriptional regulator with XRE-family HTH domain
MPSLDAMATMRLDKARGARLKAAREAIGKTQKEIGAVVHRDVITVSRWERGAPVPDDALAILATTYGTTAERLTGKVRLRVVEPSEDEPALDPKEQVRRTALYLRASPRARYAFEHYEDRYTHHGKIPKLDLEEQTKALLAVIEDDKRGRLPEPDVQLDTTTVHADPVDPDAPKR